MVVFVVDGREGLVPGDQEIAAALRASNVPVLMAVNKTDDRARARPGRRVLPLGFEPVVEIAAEHGDGVGDLLDEVDRRACPTPPRRTPSAAEPSRRLRSPSSAVRTSASRRW